MGARTFKAPCACGKPRYRTSDDALAVALSATRKRGTPLRIYACPDKGGFHLTKRPARPAVPTPRTPRALLEYGRRLIAKGADDD